MHAATLTHYLKWNRYTEKEAKERLYALNLVCIKTRSQCHATWKLSHTRTSKSLQNVIFYPVAVNVCVICARLLVSQVHVQETELWGMLLRSIQVLRKRAVEELS